MEASHGHSKPCCNIPPVVSKGYQAKGSYVDIGGYKTYVTGPQDADKAIVVIMDIFGFFEQTLQGADILATSDGNQKFKVYIPDWFKGKPCPIDIYPPDNDDKKKQLGEFFETFPPPKIADQVPGYVDAIKSKDSISKFGILGFCWGGKVAALTTKASTNPFTVAGCAHPAMVDPADAEGIKVPFVMLASGDEPADDVKKFETALGQTKKHVEIFGDQIHGWMAARADLSDDKVKKEYERGYKTVCQFFCDNI